MRANWARKFVGLFALGVVLVAAKRGESLVADAAMRGDVATVRALLQKGADVNAPQGDGMTALHWAARSGNTELAALLIRARANTRATTRIGAYTPLHIASEIGSVAVVSALLKAGADAKAITTTGITSLH